MELRCLRGRHNPPGNQFVLLSGYRETPLPALVLGMLLDTLWTAAARIGSSEKLVASRVDVS
jgi:hypothetical protein